MNFGLKGGISIDADFGLLRYVLWCCGSHQLFTFIQIGSGHTVQWIEFHSSSFCGQSYWSNRDAIVLLQLLLLILRPYFQLTQYRWIEFHSSSFCGQSYWSTMDAIVLLQLGFNGVHTGGTCHTIDLDHKRKKKLIVTKYFPDHEKRALNAMLWTIKEYDHGDL